MWEFSGSRGARIAMALFLLVPLACKQVTETVVEKGVKVAKDTTKGIADGIDEGRKKGQSTDDAFIVSKTDDLAGKGSVAVRAVRSHDGNVAQSDVELALENTTDKPLRFTGIEVMALDKEGFVSRTDSAPHEVTVPPKAKEKVVVMFPIAPGTLGKVRVWGTDYAVPPTS